MDIHALLAEVAVSRGLRQSTVFSYRRLLLGMGIDDDSLTLEEVQDRLLQIDNINTRRAATIACRSVLNMPRLKIPKGVPVGMTCLTKTHFDSL